MQENPGVFGPHEEFLPPKKLIPLSQTLTGFALVKGSAGNAVRFESSGKIFDELKPPGVLGAGFDYWKTPEWFE